MASRAAIVNKRLTPQNRGRSTPHRRARPTPRRRGRSKTVALIVAGLALAIGAPVFIVDANMGTALVTAALPKPFDKTSDRISFEERFRSVSTPESDTAELALGPREDDATLAARELKLHDAKGLLALQLASGNWRSTSADQPNGVDEQPKVDEPKLVDEPKPAAPAAVSAATGIPLPKSRPAAAALDAHAAVSPVVAYNTPAPDKRTILQKLSDIMLPDKVKLASLTPSSGLFKRGPDLAALGYDPQTAVYDIAARTVYLPGGGSIEAHSGMGDLRDDPENVNKRMVGATPPATYSLRPREALFHGVRALRMIPVEGSNTLGRTGLLTHSYMLGPDGDSNGCISFKDYDRFLKAYDNGEINRIVVVPSLNGIAPTSQRSTSES